MPVQVARISRRTAAAAPPVARRAGGEDCAGHGLVERPGETVRGSGRAGQGDRGTSFPAARVAGGSMKKNQTVQGTFSKIFGKKHANPDTASLYLTNRPWIFTQEALEEGTRDFDGIYYGDNRFDTVSESGTATLKARPRVRPLLTFLPLVSMVLLLGSGGLRVCSGWATSLPQGRKPHLPWARGHQLHPLSILFLPDASPGWLLRGGMAKTQGREAGSGGVSSLVKTQGEVMGNLCAEAV